MASMQSQTVAPDQVLRKYRIVAVVGASKNPEKDAHTVPAYMKEHGFQIIPVNPTADQILGEKVYPSLLDLPAELARKVEVVDVFRPSEELPEIARQASEMKKRSSRPFVFWAQLGLENEEAKGILTESRVDYVMNQCMRVVHQMMQRS